MMSNIDIVKEFQKIEERIARDIEQNKDVTGHLRAKARLLKLCYSQLSDAMRSGKIESLAPIYAKELAFLNNIKEIQIQINEDSSETDEEISKVHTRMRDSGFGWILDNLPEKKED